MASTLKCTQCKEDKTLDNFCKDKSRGRGYSYKCRPCASTSGRSYYSGHRDKVLKNSAKVYQLNQKNIKARTRQYAEDNPEKRQAKSAVRHAVNIGKLIRPDTCSSCTEPCKPDGHHDDYSKPLVVRWLCRSCHTLHHKQVAQ